MNALKYYRTKKNLTITQLGNLIEMHPSNISMVERGHRKAWRNMKLRLAEALNVTEDQMFDENNNLKMYFKNIKE
ncbi:helix-turn-helix domain-containing protein [Alkalihalobacillus deserti]|uniref:helix-turn-helix domain-containing protein n=1 Tax=Alkalihalobacillus deserti TaxID=2879466 RepID=UPI001D14BEB8|nr:helix-turn-helix transcriptional regulator [Alkalihalobacillus deserti]